MRRVGPDRVPAVVFVAENERQAAEAFALNAFDYVVKPVSDDRFRATLERARQRLREGNVHVLLARLSSLISEVRGIPNYPQRLLTRSRGQMHVLRGRDRLDRGGRAVFPRAPAWTGAFSVCASQSAAWKTGWIPPGSRGCTVPRL